MKIKRRKEAMLQLGQFLPSSRANGPGERAVVWLQGCSLGCRECFNPHLHSPEGGEPVRVDDLFARIVSLGCAIQGVTISGGEPLQQRVPLLALLKRIRNETSLSMLLFTGYTLDEVRRMPQGDEILGCVDVLIAGRYDHSRRLARDLRGSLSKTVHFITKKYGQEDLKSVPPAEIIISPGGRVAVSGIDPPTL